MLLPCFFREAGFKSAIALMDRYVLWVVHVRSVFGNMIASAVLMMPYMLRSHWCQSGQLVAGPFALRADVFDICRYKSALEA